MTIQLHHKIYAILGVIAVSLGTWIAIELALTERSTRALISSTADSAQLINRSLKGTHKNGDDGYLVLTQRLLQNANAAMNAVKQTAQDSNRIAKAQEKPVAALTASSVALLNNASTTVNKLNASIDSINGTVADVRAQTIPRLDTSLDSLDSEIGTLNAATGSLNGLISDLRPTARSITGMVDQATVTLGSMDGTLVTANRLLADPELQGIIHNLDLMSANGNLVAGNMALVTLDVHNILNPKKMTFVEALAEAAAHSAVGAVLGPLLSHFLPTRIGIVNTPIPITITKP